MTEANELQALDTISAELDDAQIKVILATQCIKAQAFLVAKLKKQVKRKKEICGFIGSANLNLQSEITQAEQEIKSFQISNVTIKMANVELKKELLIAKEKKLDAIEKVKNGEQKYENLWLECKSRYESLPYVQRLLKTTENAKIIDDQISALNKQAEILAKEIKAKNEAFRKVDRDRVIQLAEFMVNERPKLILRANETSRAISDLSNELKNLNININIDTQVKEAKAKETIEETNSATTVDEKCADESALIMPKLQLDSLALDDLISVKLDQVKMKSTDYTTGLERSESFFKSYFSVGTSIFNRKPGVDESISSYFSKPSTSSKDTQNYSKKKLINILEDVKIDAVDARDIISKVNPDTLQPVESISAGSRSHDEAGVEKNKDQEPMLIEEEQDIEVNSSNKESIVKPPSQFLDESLKSQKSQDHKKIVSFDLPSTSQNAAASDQLNDDEVFVEKNANKTSNSQLDVSDNDDGFMRIKEMVLKKHNLDLTPPFVYSKNTILQTENTMTTSKFFKNNDNAKADYENNQKEKNSKILAEKYETKNIVPTIEKTENPSKIKQDEEIDMIVSSAKKQKIDEMSKPEKSFGGYLFSHGPQGLPDYLDVSDVSLCTTIDDGDIDFPHCIDSSILSSPKADLTMGSENTKILSQNAPNFLSGLRKTGLSFFGHSPAGDSKTDSSAAVQGNHGFNFNFGGEEKKSRGGFFSMFQ